MTTILARFWPYIAGAALILAAFIGFRVVYGKLEVAQVERAKALAKLEVSNASIAGLQTDIDRQNAAIMAAQAEGERRLLEGRALILAEVRKGARTLEAASRLSKNPKTGGDQSRTSEAVIALKGDL